MVQAKRPPQRKPRPAKWSDYDEKTGRSKSGQLLDELDTLPLTLFTFGDLQNANELRSSIKDSSFGPSKWEVSTLARFIAELKSKMQK